MNLRLLNIITCLLITACVATSCLEDDEYDYEYSADASITAFSIGDIETEYQATVDGKDTTLTATVTGTNYPFVIDQNQGLIYNVDSLPVGTDVSKVVPEISADGYVFIVAETDSIWEEGDSLDFRQPIQFKVMSMQGTYGRTYTAKVNVHQQDPNEMVWTRFESNFNAEIKAQKAVYFNRQIVVFAEQENQVAVTMASQDNGNQWTALQTIDIPVKADYSSVIVWGESLYLLAENELYQSTDGLHWTSAGSELRLSALTAAIASGNEKKLTGVTTNNLYAESNDGNTWTTYAALPEDFAQSVYSYASYPLATNDALHRIVLMGQNNVAEDSVNIVWSQLATEHEWTPLSMEANKHECPNLENAGMIHYNGLLYAFGGPGKNGSSADAFAYSYVSNDNGIGWDKVTEDVLFPEDFPSLYQQAEGNYSFVVDDNHFVWFMWGNTGEVWRGRINKLGFVNQ
ncbi:MAG: hypothetical protein IJ456_03545 [Bacteroides sp.]|nr:hypothetical protein [Bacteroides sp.]